jgi:hypothetical protein
MQRIASQMPILSHRIMSDQDVTHIHRIRSTQLRSLDPAVDDYYSIALKRSSTADKTDATSGLFARTLLSFTWLPLSQASVLPRQASSNRPDSSTRRFSPAIDAFINPYFLEKIQGALGQIQFNNIRKPKASIQVDAMKVVDGRSQAFVIATGRLPC